jgi:hypothetical protein
MNDDLGAFGTDTYDQDSQGSKLEDTENGSEYNGGSREDAWIDRYNDERCAK